jgi:hypothetical protein
MKMHGPNYKICQLVVHQLVHHTKKKRDKVRLSKVNNTMDEKQGRTQVHCATVSHYLKRNTKHLKEHNTSQETVQRFGADTDSHLGDTHIVPLPPTTARLQSETCCGLTHHFRAFCNVCHARLLSKILF